MNAGAAPAKGANVTLTFDMTRAQAQRHLARLFDAAGIESARTDARVLLCAALSIDHAALIRDPDAAIGPAAAILTCHAARRLMHEPVSRILGAKEFWGLPFRITPDVLDPRPDTEVLVEAVMAGLGARRHEPLRLLDLGTGSGAILAALLHECPAAFGIGVDHAMEACRIAGGNLRALGFGPRSAIVQGSWCAALVGPFDVVVSNPPYIPHGDLGMLAPDVRCHDPLTALDGGADGLDPYRAIIPALSGLLRPGGMAAFEGGFDQSAAIAAMMRAADLTDVGVRRDLAGHDRIVFGKRTP